MLRCSLVALCAAALISVASADDPGADKCLDVAACPAANDTRQNEPSWIDFGGAHCDKSVYERKVREYNNSKKCGTTWDKLFPGQPWLVTMYIAKNARDHDLRLIVGAGVLISDKHFLTAASRVEGYVNDPSEIGVQLGTTGTYSHMADVTIRVKSIFLHPHYDFTSLENDIAVVELEKSIPDRNNINAACLPISATPVGITGVVPVLSTPNYYWPKPFLIIDPKDCQNRLREKAGEDFILNERTFFCAGGQPGKGLCNGDQGSPLIWRKDDVYHVVGLNSWGLDCEKGYPDVYTNVYSYLPWINCIMSSSE